MIIAIDPGQHTGLAFRLDNGAWTTILADKVPDAGERLDMVMGLLCEQLGKHTTTAIVIETFRTMGYLSKYGIETIELIGAIKGLCYLFETPIIRQDPNHRAGFEATAKKMLVERSKQLNVLVSDHEVSALAHLLRYEHTQSKADRVHSAANTNQEHAIPNTNAPNTASSHNGRVPLTITPVTK